MILMFLEMDLIKDVAGVVAKIFVVEGVADVAGEVFASEDVADVAVLDGDKIG